MTNNEYKTIANDLDRIEHICSRLTFGYISIGEATAKIMAEVDTIRDDLLHAENAEGVRQK